MRGCKGYFRPLRQSFLANDLEPQSLVECADGLVMAHYIRILPSLTAVAILVPTETNFIRDSVMSLVFMQLYYQIYALKSTKYDPYVFIPTWNRSGLTYM